MADVYLAVAPMASPAKAETPWRRNGDDRLCAVVLNLAPVPSLTPTPEWAVQCTKLRTDTRLSAAVLAAVTVAVVCVVALGVSSSEAGSKNVLVMNWEQQEIATVEHRTRRPSIPKAVLKAGGGLFKPTLKLHLGEIEDTMAQEESEQGADPTWIPDDEEAKLGPGMGENPEDTMSQEVQEESHDGTFGTTFWNAEDEEAKLGPGMGEHPEDTMAQEVQEESEDGTVGTTSWVPDDEEHIITK